MRRRRPPAARPGRWLAAAVVVLVAAVVPAYADHRTGHAPPSGPAPNEFAPDFTPPLDSEWGFPIGGFGGLSRGAPLTHDPVVLVHGNTEDHTFFEAAENPPTVINVRQRFLAAGYTEQEVWALSYNGARCGNGAACGSANDVNVPDLYAFLLAVLDYTGAERIDIVAHSLGVTVVRATLRDHPELLDRIDDLVFAAGANHGTTACRGLEDSWYGCDEIAPGSPWLADLNQPDETPGDANYVTICDCTGVVDTFFLGPDARSPQLDGALNHEMPGTAHFSLVRGQAAFEFYLPIVRDDDEPAPVPTPPTPAPGPAPSPPAGAPDQPPPPPAPGGPLPTTGGGAVLALIGALVVATGRWRRG